MKDTQILNIAKKSSYVINTSFFIIHIGLFLFFWHYHVRPMAFFNIFSVLFYSCTFILIRKEIFDIFALAVYLEVILHMTLAVIFVGWNSGFQVTLIGMNILLFYAEYYSRHLHTGRGLGLPLGLTSMVAYLGAYVYTSFHPARYPLPAQVSFVLEITWGIIVFVTAILYLNFFVAVAYSFEDTMSEQLHHDELTRLPNRYSMMEYLKKLKNEGGYGEFWVAMADIDNFKSVNDTYGHNCGDFVLKTIAEILNDFSGEIEVCRWGGEEFLMVGRMDGDLASQCAKLDRLRKTVEEHRFWYEEEKLSLTITIGVAQYDEENSVSEWINHADKKLYEGKLSGKNCVIC